MTDLAEFLLARIAEDKAEVPAEHVRDDYGTGFNLDNVTVEVGCVRWLAECEAKRLIVADYGDGGDSGDGGLLLMRLALPYADHPDYRQEWRP